MSLLGLLKTTRVSINLKFKKMNPLFKSLSLIALFTISITSCKKATVTPNQTSLENKKDETVNNKVAGPLIISNSNMLVTNFGSTKLYTVFSSGTASFYQNTLYAHCATSASGPFTNGVLPATYNSGNARYNIAPTYPVGTVVYLFYSTANGTSYPSGSASPIYTATVLPAIPIGTVTPK